MMKTTFRKTFEYEMTVDTETGEVVEIKCLGAVEDATPKEVKEVKEKKEKKTTTRKKKKDESDSPQLILEENKCSLNTAAVELLGVEPGDKLAIEYEKHGNSFRPVLFISDKGNKLTKSNTIACRGSKSEELAKYGTVFEIVTHDSKESAWYLNGDSASESEEDVDVNLPLDVDLPELVEGEEDLEDMDITEIDASFFDID